MIYLIFNRKTSLILLSFLGLSFKSPALYVGFESKKALLNTETMEHYDIFSKAVAVAREKGADEAFEALMEYPDVLETITEHAAALKEYGDIASDLQELPITSGATLIHKQWVIGPKHVLQQVGAYLATTNGKIIGTLAEVFDYPDEEMDLALGRLAVPSTLTPVKISKNFAKMSDLFYAYSDTVHNQEGEIIGNTQKKNMPLFAYCKLSSEEELAKIYKQMSFSGPTEFQFGSHHGDSGGGLFVKVSNTGNPLKDYELVGVFDPVMNFSEEKQQIISSTAAIWVSNPEVTGWIEAVMESLGY